jgi:hypothetical protein
MGGTEMSREKSWAQKYYEGAIGLTIVGVEIDEDGFPVLLCTDKARPAVEVRLEVSQDEEGNGPGFLFGLPTPGIRI